MACELCEKNPIETTFSVLAVCNKCKTAEIEALKKDKKLWEEVDGDD